MLKIHRKIRNFATPVCLCTTLFLSSAGLAHADWSGLGAILGKKSSIEATNPACTAQLVAGRPPALPAKMAEGLNTICYEEYTIGYSAKTRTPLWSAEHLTAQRLNAGKNVARANTFHEEESISPDARAYLKDYARSGYDRGHMSPSRDFSTAHSQNESFSLANMVPQDPKNNRHLWEGIESGTRNFTLKNGEVYVITGPLFRGKTLQFLKNRVAIPTHLFKLVYDPVHKVGGVFLVENTNTTEIQWKSISEFEQISGYQFGLGSPALMGMPSPKQHF